MGLILRILFFLLIIAIIVGYLLWPLDLLPDFIPLIGWIDDLIVGIGGLLTGFIVLLRG